MMRLACVLVFLALAYAARADDAPVTDPALVRHHYREVAARPEYHETDETLADVHWSNWLGQWLRHLSARFQDFKYAGQLSGTARVFVVVMTGLAVAGLVVLLLRLTRRRRERLSTESAESDASRMLLTPRQYERQVAEAVRAGDWRAAWLTAWLQFLARLENRRLVEPDRSLTNREYLARLRRQPLPAGALPLLAGMVEDYDCVVYGRRPIDEAGWTSFRERIDEATLQLGLRERSTGESP